MSETQGYEVYKTATIPRTDLVNARLGIWKLSHVAKDMAALSSDPATKAYWEMEAAKADMLHKRLEAI